MPGHGGQRHIPAPGHVAAWPEGPIAAVGMWGWHCPSEGRGHCHCWDWRTEPGRSRWQRGYCSPPPLLPPGIQLLGKVSVTTDRARGHRSCPIPAPGTLYPTAEQSPFGTVQPKAFWCHSGTQHWGSEHRSTTAAVRPTRNRIYLGTGSLFKAFCSSLRPTSLTRAHHSRSCSDCARCRLAPRAPTGAAAVGRPRDGSVSSFTLQILNLVCFSTPPRVDGAALGGVGGTASGSRCGRCPRDPAGSAEGRAVRSNKAELLPGNAAPSLANTAHEGKYLIAGLARRRARSPLFRIAPGADRWANTASPAAPPRQTPPFTP